MLALKSCSFPSCSCTGFHNNPNTTRRGTRLIYGPANQITHQFLVQFISTPFFFGLKSQTNHSIVVQFMVIKSKKLLYLVRVELLRKKLPLGWNPIIFFWSSSDKHHGTAYKHVAVTCNRRAFLI